MADENAVELLISHALVRAKHAIEQDEAGNKDEAVEHYKAASNLLRSIAYDGVLDLGARVRLREIAGWYDQRLIKMEIEPPEIREIRFEEIPIHTVNKPIPPPNNLHRRSYWLMRTWAKTMMSGGYITPQLYLPRTMWFQPGVKLAAIAEKISCLEQVLDQLLRLPQEDRDDTMAFLNTLNQFIALLDTLQKSLDKHLHCVVGLKEESAKVETVRTKKQRFASKMRRLGSTISKGATRLGNSAKLDDNTAYIELLLQVFLRAQVLDEWMDSLSTHAGILQALERIAQFFYEVVCSFVLEDMNVLLERYMKLSKKDVLS